jgi:hypothetical protein
LLLTSPSAIIVTNWLFLFSHPVGDRSDSCRFPRHPYLAHDPYRVILEPRLTIHAATYVRMKLKAAEEVRHEK